MSTLTDADIKQLAMDTVDGKVFVDRFVHEHEVHLLPQIFMPLIFGDPIDMSDFGMLYEYLSEAGPRSVNGYPIFTSMRMLSKSQMSLFKQYHTEYTALKETYKQV